MQVRLEYYYIGKGSRCICNGLRSADGDDYKYVLTTLLLRSLSDLFAFSLRQTLVRPLHAFATITSRMRHVVEDHITSSIRPCSVNYILTSFAAGFTGSSPRPETLPAVCTVCSCGKLILLQISYSH
jgi:hypothetical protein